MIRRAWTAIRRAVSRTANRAVAVIDEIAPETVALIALCAAAVYVGYAAIPDSPPDTVPAGVHKVTVDGTSTSTWCEHGNLMVLRTGDASYWFGPDSETLRIVPGGCEANAQVK